MWKVCAVAMSLDQTHSLFLKKDWKTHSFQTFQIQFLEEKTNKQAQTNENQVIGLFSKQMCFRLLKESNYRIQMCAELNAHYPKQALYMENRYLLASARIIFKLKGTNEICKTFQISRTPQEPVKKCSAFN